MIPHLNLLISIIKIGDSPSRVEIQIPKWSEIKFDVLPISKTSKANPIKSDQKEVSEDILERKIDSRIIIIVNNIASKNNLIFAIKTFLNWCKVKTTLYKTL